MNPAPNRLRIPLQVGSILRIKSTGEISISNPTLELEPAELVPDAVLSYTFDQQTHKHVLRMEEPRMAPRTLVPPEPS